MGTRRYSPDKNLNAFGEWVVSNGGFIHESLTFTAPDSELGSQVVTASKILPNTRLLTCPHTLAIDYTLVKSHFSPKFIAATTPHAALCMFLAYQWLQGEGSFWWPYLRILPSEFDTPLYFEDDDLMWLQGCNLNVKEVEDRKRVWSGELKAAVAALEKDGKNTAGYTWDLFLWAATVFSSRSFSGKLMTWTSSHTLASMGEPDSLPALFPLIDSVNHQPLTKITWQPGDHTLSAVSGEVIAPGGEVCNNYGPKSNEELLMGYGFTLLSNPFDTVVLQIKAPLSPEQEAIYSLHASLPSFSSDGIFHLLPHTSSCSSSYPPALIHLFNILTATPNELPLLQPSTTTSTTPTLRNTLATHNQLLVALRQKLSAFPRESDLPQCTNSKRRSAKIYRDAQLEILVGAIVESEGAVRKILEDDSRAVTLASILSSPEEGGFAAAIEKAFGTVDEETLNEEEQGDIIFTLYICWQYILHVRNSQTQTQKPPPLWKPYLQYLLSTHKYGTIHESESVPEAGEFVKELYDGIFPAATEVAPEVFAGGEWTMELLSWGMRVFGGEGVPVWVEEDMEVFVVCVE